MTSESILSLLRAEIKKINPSLPANLGPDSHFKYDWKLDSLNLVELVARIEQRFDIMVPDEDIEQLINLNATVTYIQSHLTS
jgi:acyl carrier protein